MLALAGRCSPSTTRVGAGPGAVVADRATGRVVVALRDARRIALLDGATGAIERRVPLRAPVERLALASPGGPVLVPGERLGRFALDTGVLTPRPVPGRPHAVTGAAGQILVAAALAGRRATTPERIGGPHGSVTSLASGTMPALTERLRAAVAPDFGPETVAHDLSHLDRVCALALRIAAEEGGDEDVLVAAAYLHDYHRVTERERGARAAAGETEARVHAILERVGFPVQDVPRVLEAIAHASRYSFAGHDLGAPALEAVVLRDADNLDAMGATGIARTFMFGGHLGTPAWVDGVPPGATYVPGRGTSVVNHFHEKLLRLRDEMTTATGARLAEERHAFMLRFLEQLERERRG